jgi:putative endonuclease
MLDYLKMYYVYLLRSKSNSRKLYVGYTSNLEQRLQSHNEALVGFTSRFKPWELIYYEAYIIKSQAIEREIQFKRHGNVMARLKKRLQL